jgi:PPIC-type peptidyl-prolyl cis-trans isomerase-like protein
MFISKFRIELIGLLLVPCCLGQCAKASNADAAQPERVRLSEILIETPEPYHPEQVDEAQKRAEALREKIRMGADFASVADTDSKQGKATVGDIGYFSRGDLPQEIEELVFRMKPGDVSDVIRTQQGFLILKITEVIQARPSAPPPSLTAQSESWDFKTWIAIGAAFGTLVTALTNFVRWWRERSFSHTIHVQAEGIVALSQLLETLSAAPSATVDKGSADNLAARARRGLTELMQALSTTLDRASKFRMPPSGETSFFRRWFLLFRPRTFRAGVVHFAFYSCLVPLFYFIYVLGVDPRDWQFHLRLWFYALRMNVHLLLLLLVVVLSLRYWAIVESRWLSPAQEKPGRFARALLWYTPTSFGELLARLFLLLAVSNWLGDAYAQRYVVPYVVQWLAPYIEPRSDLSLVLIFEVGLVGSILICYFWARAEYRLNCRRTPRPAFPHNLRFLYTPRTKEAWFCQLAFYGTLVVCACQAWAMADTLSTQQRIIASGLIRDWITLDIPADARGYAVFGVELSLVFLFAVSAAMPLYGAYRWGLAEFRARSNIQAATQEPVAEGPAPA